MDYKDQLVVTGQLSDTGNPLSVNVPKSYRMGIELQTSLTPCEWFDWQLNATLSRNRIKDFTEYIYEDGWANPISIGSFAFAIGGSFQSIKFFKRASLSCAVALRKFSPEKRIGAHISNSRS